MVLTNFLLIILLMLMGTAYFLLLTTSGLQFDIDLAKRYLPGKLQIAQVEGNLLSSFTLKNVYYQNESQQIAVQSFSLNWKPEGLLLKKFIVNSIGVDHAKVIIKKMPPNTDASSKINPLDLLRHVVIHQIKLNQVELKLDKAEIDLQGTLEKNWDVKWFIQIPDLAVFFSQSSGSLLTSGNIAGPFLSPEINASLNGSKIVIADQKINQLNARAMIMVKPNVNSTLSVSASGLKINDYKLNTFDFNASGHIAFQKKALIANIKSVFEKQYPISAVVTFPRFSGFDTDQPISANVNSSFTTLNWLTQFIPTITKPEGLIKANLNINGTIAHPTMIGNITIVNGRVKIPSLGITLQNMNVMGESTRDNQLNFKGTVRSGHGDAQIQGVFDYSKADYPVTLKIKGTELQAINLPEYHVIITPDVTLAYAKQNLQLQGTIVIPTAEITPKNFNSTITLSSDVVFVDAKKTVTTLPFTTSLQLHIQLGDGIHITYNNLDTHLTGSVQLSQIPGAIINAAGELNTKKGTYTAYGQTLKITTGHLIYTGGSLMDPGLNISAVKEIKTVSTGGNVSSFTGTTTLKPVFTGRQTITAGVQLSGTLNNPTMTLFSNQSLSQADILSYILFGYPQSQASGHEYGAILSALSSLNSKSAGVGNITKRVQDKLGFSEFNVESAQVYDPNKNTTVSATTFVIGKQLSSKLSMHYSVGLFNPVSILSLKYKLSKRWAIQSETSTMDNGADLLYSIERD